MFRFSTNFHTRLSNCVGGLEVGVGGGVGWGGGLRYPQKFLLN